MAWHKPSVKPHPGSFRQGAEFVIHAEKGQDRTQTRQCLPDVYWQRVNCSRKVQPTGKPVPLVKDLLAVCQPGGMVLDPFLGGGTTALACLETCRRFTGVELSPECAARAADRIRQAEAALKQGVKRTRPGRRADWHWK